MTDHPSTYKAEDTHRPGVQWDDRAFLHQTGDGGGVLDGAKSIRDGTFAELIRHVMLLPEENRSEYYIQKAGDRKFEHDEIVGLYNRTDFPRG